MNRSKRSAAIADALEQIQPNANGLAFTGLSRLFGLWQCSLTCKAVEGGYTWVAGLGLRVLGMPTMGDKLHATQDDALSSAIPLLRFALDDVRDDMVDPWSDPRRVAALSSALGCAAGLRG